MAKKKKRGVGQIPILQTINLYSRLLTAWRTKGRLDVPDKHTLGKDQLYYSTNRIYTTKGIKYPIFIHDLPVELSKGVITDLRNDITDAILNYNTLYGTTDVVKVNFITVADNYQLDFNNMLIQGRINHWSRQEQRIIREKEVGTTLEDELKSDKYSESTIRMVQSFRLMKRLSEERASFFKAKFIIELEATSDDALDEALKVADKWFFFHSIVPKHLFFQSNEYYMSYSPLGNNKTPRKSMLRKMHQGDVLPDEIINNMSVLTHGGTIGDNLGVPHGIDIFSRTVFSMDLSKGTDARNILLTAGTGQGKSVFMKSALCYYDLMGYSTITVDIEGDEYTMMASLLGANRISISGGSGQYVNTLAISELTGDAELDEALYQDAQEMTERVFDILLRDDKNVSGMTPSQETILDILIDRAYRKHGVLKDDPTTWHKSERCTYFTLYEELIDIMSSKDNTYANINNHEINDMYEKLRRYFEKTGGRNEYFKNPISVKELLRNRHLVFSFGMRGQDGASKNSKSLELRQLYVSYLSILKANYNRSKGRKTVLVLEELQRYLEQPQSAEVVSSLASGGRKRGFIIYFITNSPRGLLDSSDSDGGIKGEKGTAFKAIVDNLTMNIIGALPRESMMEVIRRYDLEDATSHLMYLSDVYTSESGHPFKNAFFIRYNGQSSMIRAVCHPDLINLPIFSTTIEQTDDESEEEKIQMHYGEMTNNIRRSSSNRKRLDQSDVQAFEETLRGDNEETESDK